MAVTWNVDLSVLFGALYTDIASVRVARGLVPLVTGSLLAGQEQLRREHSPPRIVIVPTSLHFEPAQRVGTQPMRGALSQWNPRPFGSSGSGSRPTVGGSRTRRHRTRTRNTTSSTTSIPASSSCASSRARCTGTLAASRTSASATRDGSSRATITATAVCSSYPSPSAPTSPMSRGRSCRSPRHRSPDPVSSPSSLSRHYSQTVRRPSPAPSPSREAL
jgi:hypothetical protein